MLAMGLGLVTVGVGVGIKEKLQTSTSNVKVELIKKPMITVVQVYNKVKFDIAGEVLKPGVYELPAGSRIGEAMTVAGGLALNADRDWVEKNINRAKKIGDGEKIYIPKKITNNQNPITKQVSITNDQVPNQV